MAKQTKEIRLGEILRDAGLVSPAQLTKAIQEQKKTGSSLVEVLTKKRYITAQSLVDVLTYEIPLPFTKDPDKELRELLLDTGITTEEELQRLIDESELGKALVQNNYIKKFQLELARQEQQRTGLPLWRTLVNLKFLSLSQINTVLKEQMYRLQYADLDELVGEILVNTRQITKQQLQKAKDKKKATQKPLGKILTEDDNISAAEIAQTLGEYLNIPFIDLYKTTIDRQAAAMLPESFIREHKVLPIKKEQGEGEEEWRLTVAVIDPLDIAVRDNIRMMTGCEVVPLLTTEKTLTEVTDRLFVMEGSQDAPPVKRKRAIASTLKTVAFEDTGGDSTVKLVTSLIEGAIHGNATDIHLEPQPSEDLRIRYRIDGLLHDIMTVPKDTHSMVISRIKVQADMDITERRQSQDGHITMKIGESDYYMRIATLPTKLGERLVIRLLDERRVIKGLTTLGMEPQDLQRMQEFIATPYGMILVTGPVGSGKTTTLYSALNEIDVFTKSIITIEDPVEYQLAGISQVEVDSKSGLTFAAGLRSILRQDPNTLMVGEIRDPETGSVAIRAALTGQQLFSTLHTQDAAGAVTTLAYLGVQPFWIASALIGVIAQRLVRKVCPYCKEPYTPDPRLLHLLNLEEEEAYTQFYHGKGCEKCFHSGYSGRVGVFEVMPVDKEIRELIVNGAPEAQMKETAIQKGMNTLKTSGVKKIIRGETTVEETLRVIL